MRVGTVVAGYRHIDTAAAYGNEEAVGRGGGVLAITTSVRPEGVAEDTRVFGFELTEDATARIEDRVPVHRRQRCARIGTCAPWSAGSVQRL